MHTGKSTCVYLFTWKASRPLKQNTRVLQVFWHMYFLCTFKFVLKNERLCKDFDSFLYLWIIISVTVRHHLNSEETVRAVQMIQDGFSQRRVAVPLVCPQSCKQTLDSLSGDWKLQQKARAG